MTLPVIALIAERAEGTTCNGCKYREQDIGTIAYCTNPERKSVAATDRCEEYEEQ